jgi:hypothetical protein
LDGNLTTTQYDMFIDAVNLTINGSCPALPMSAR